MALSIRTGGVYRNLRGHEMLIVSRRPDGTYLSATDSVFLKDGRSQVYRYKAEDPWRLVEEVVEGA